MKATARLRNCPYSPRKMRLVADLIRGKNVEEALSILKYQNRRAYAVVLEKLVISALHNYRQINEENKVDERELIISKLMVDGGRILKRLRPAPQGRAYRVRKRSNHITLEISSQADDQYVVEEENNETNTQENISE